jgi:hypothetical protein
MSEGVDAAVQDLTGVLIGGKHSAHRVGDFLVAFCSLGDERVARRRIDIERTLEYLDCELPPGGIQRRPILSQNLSEMDEQRVWMKRISRKENEPAPC